MTFQLNPNTTDAYESKTLAQMRQLCYDALGFIDPLTVNRYVSRGAVTFSRTLQDIRVSIINRLGLAVALLANPDTFANVLSDVYNACGFAAMATHPPGVDNMLGTFINNAQRTLFARIEQDKGGVTPPTTISGSNPTTIDATAVRLLAIAEAKAHYGQQDAAAYGQQAERYLTDLTQRTPPNIVGQINAAIVAANDMLLRSYELGIADTYASKFGVNLSYFDNFNPTNQFQGSDTDIPDVDDSAVEALALANLKKKTGQSDAEALYKQVEKYLSDAAKRQPPNARSLVNSTLKMTQQTLYRKYDVFRMERWWTWTLVQGQRFYGTFGDDNANSLAPTNGVAVAGAAVASHNMTKKRWGIHAIQMSTGKVLIVGGYDASNNIQKTTDVFDPTTGIFTASGQMRALRAAYGMSELQDGRVLITGGVAAIALATTEIYSPISETFIPGHSMTIGRFSHTQTTLLDGTVLITGGNSLGANTNFLRSAELFDPGTGLYTAVGNMAVVRNQHTATLLPDGRVLIAGGESVAAAVNTAEIYDPVAKTFSNATGNMTAARKGHTATLLATGLVLIAGGEDAAGTPLSSAELFSPSANTFSATGAMANARGFGMATLLPNEKVLVVGDFIAGTGTLGEVYDPLAGIFSATANNAPVSTSYTDAVTLTDGRVLIPGGLNNFGLAVNTAMFYNPTSSLFSATGNLTQGTVFYQIVAETANGSSLPGTEFFVAGVPANTSVVLTWVGLPNQPFVTSWAIYGRVTGGTKQFIARVGSQFNTYTDDGTIPPNGDLPTINATAGPGALDPRHVTWGGLTFNDNVWNKLDRGIPPEAFAANIQGVPTNYEIRQSLEIWPAPSSSDWKVQIKGYFQPMVFESDNDYTTIDWQAIWLRATADLKVIYKQPDALLWEQRAKEYIGSLVAGSHMTARYVPGFVQERNAVRPKLGGPYIGYP